jgi:hypothetical protein
MAHVIMKPGITLLQMLDNQELKSIEQKIFHKYDIKNEDVFKRCMITARLGRMYQNAY